MSGIFQAIADFFTLIYSAISFILSLLKVLIENIVTGYTVVSDFLISDTPVIPWSLGVIVLVAVVFSLILKIFGRSFNNDH